MRRIKMNISYMNTNDNTTTTLMRNVGTGPLTVDRQYDYSNSLVKGTPFKELTLVDWKRSFDLETIHKIIPNKRSATLDATKILDTLYDFIYSIWDTSKFNLMFHSSGYDSRILSSMFKRVYNEKGGQILFVCFPDEEKLMADIMRYEGWDEKQFTFYNEFDLPTSKVFDFNSLYKQFNGVSAYPFYRSNACVRWLKDTNKIPLQSIRIWGGGFFNETFKASSTIDDFLKQYYYHQYNKNLTIFEDEFIQPVMNFNTLALIFSSHRHSSPNDFRLKLVSTLDPALAKLPRGSWYTPNTKLHDVVYAKLILDYKSSFYYKNIDQKFDPSPFVADNKAWWYKCSLASFIEYYINNGINIKY